MSKKSKAEKRKAKLRARKQQIALSEQSLSTRLSCALEKLCEPVMPEYIDDSNGPDLVGRRIVWRMGQIAWNIVVTGRRESISEAFQRTQLDVEQQKTVQNEIIGLAKRKYAEFPNLRTAIRDFSVLLGHPGFFCIACRRCSPHQSTSGRYISGNTVSRVWRA